MIIPLELSESELITYKDTLYAKAKSGKKDFHSLLEVICCRENIIDTIRKIKSNHGFETKGVDNISGNDLLQGDANEFFEMVLQKFEEYTANKVKRVYIPKKNGEPRPLGIPAIIDRIVQTMIANIIEPIMEGQFYEHSYGFRPMRSIENAYGYLSALVNSKNGRYWVVEGDIKGFFDNVNHNIMINKLYKYGIKDKRLLMVIKKILKAGIVDKDTIIEENPIGTPQGGTLSPLLANIYLTDFDLWVDKQYRKFKTDKEIETGEPVKYQHHRIRNISKSNLKEGYLIRYADDWIIVTSSEKEAIKWKYACKKFFKDKLKLELSDEKTIITNLSKTKMNFLGISSFVRMGSKGKYTLRTEPNKEMVALKMKSVYKALINIRKSSNDTKLIESIARFNEIVRSINQFYEITTLYNIVLSKYEWQMKDSLVRTARKTKLEWTRVSKCENLKDFKRYKNNNPKTIAYNEGTIKIGLEKLGAGKYRKPIVKAQWITPYSVEGREAYEKYNKTKWGTIPRNPWFTLTNLSDLIAKNPNKIYNLEYFINRPMAYNRDKGRCRVCKKVIPLEEVNIHHIEGDLEIDKVNKLKNLVTLCKDCHYIKHKKSKPKTTAKQKIGKIKINKNGIISKSPIKPRKEVLLEEIKTTSFVQLGKKYGVSDNAVRKWAKNYGIYDQRMIKYKKNT